MLLASSRKGRWPGPPDRQASLFPLSTIMAGGDAGAMIKLGVSCKPLEGLELEPSLASGDTVTRVTLAITAQVPYHGRPAGHFPLSPNTLLEWSTCCLVGTVPPPFPSHGTHWGLGLSSAGPTTGSLVLGPPQRPPAHSCPLSSCTSLSCWESLICQDPSLHRWQRLCGKYPDTLRPSHPSWAPL